jgi:hypothetical protein
MKEVDMLARCQFVVCTFSSNVGELLEIIGASKNRGKKYKKNP